MKAFTFHGSYSSKILAARKERATPGSFIHKKDGRYYVLKPKRVKSNPRIRPAWTYKKIGTTWRFPKWALTDPGDKANVNGDSFDAVLLGVNDGWTRGTFRASWGHIGWLDLADGKMLKVKSNPSASKRLVKIYGRVLTIHAMKTGYHRHCDAECKSTGHKYVHDFKPGVKLLGIPDGASLVLKDGSVIRLSNGSQLISDREY